MSVKTAELNSVDPRAWLTDTLDRITDRKTNRLGELLPGVTSKAEHNKPIPHAEDRAGRRVTHARPDMSVIVTRLMAFLCVGGVGAGPLQDGQAA